jgi:hypothetical protein
MTRIATSLFLSILAGACVVTTPADPPRQPAPAPTPAPAPRPPVDPQPAPDPDPIAEHCAPDADPIYVETVSAIDGAARERLTILASGAWTFESAAGGGLRPTDRGCLEVEMQQRFAHALDRADFQPPPPPEIRCMALPATAIDYQDVAGGRSARATYPCGDEVSTDVANLSTAARMLTVEPQRATAIPLP